MTWRVETMGRHRAAVHWMGPGQRYVLAVFEGEGARDAATTMLNLLCGYALLLPPEPWKDGTDEPQG